MAIISAQNVTKRFVRRQGWFRQASSHVVTAVDHLELVVEEGEFLGILGPNGAGKSTTIKMLTGILHPTEGTIEVAGWSPQRHRMRLALNIGIVFGQRSQLWWDLPLKQSFAILQRMYRVKTPEYRVRLDQLEVLLDLRAFWDTPVRQLSLGQRMRGELAAAMLHAPKLLFLDEPTIGLDVEAKAAIRQFLRSVNRESGTTIILTTHDMSDVEELCQRIVVIQHGHTAFDGTLEQLHQQVGVPSTMTVTFAQAIRSDVAATVDGEVQVEGRRVTVGFNRVIHHPLSLIDQMRKWGDVVDIQMADPPLDVVMRELYHSVGQTP